MAETNMRGNPVHTAGDLPAVGEHAPPFTLTGASLDEVTLHTFAGKSLVINIFPSVDTATCATSVRTFNEKVAGRDDAAVLNVSADLPFAQARFCASEGLDNVTNGSVFRSDFGDTYGIRMTDGPLEGLLARAVVVVDADGNVAHTELVPDIVDEPDYDAAFAALG